MASVCVLLAEGFEEIEAVTVIDVLRRAEIDTVVVGVTGKTVTGSHGIRIGADIDLPAAGAREWDLVALPGGMPGARNLKDNPEVQQLLRRQHAAGRRLAAICAAPIALSAADVLEGRKVTSYPTFASQLEGATYVETPVVVDGTVTTSRGAGTAMAFALSLVEQLSGPAVARQQAERMLVNHP